MADSGNSHPESLSYACLTPSDFSSLKVQPTEEEIKKIKLWIDYLANHYAYKRQNMREDLIQEGWIGVMEAAEKFDKSKNTAFSTYAVYYIKKRMIDYMRKFSLPLTVSVNSLFGTSKTENLTRLKKTNPWINNLAHAYMHRVDLLSDNEMLEYMCKDFGAENEMIDRILLDEFRELFERFSSRLGERERKALIMRMQIDPDTGKQYTLERIGKDLGITRERVRQLILRAIKKIQKAWFFYCKQSKNIVKNK